MKTLLLDFKAEYLAAALMVQQNLGSANILYPSQVG